LIKTDRRTFLQLLAAGALTCAFPSSIVRALEIPASHRSGTIRDVEHVVILMQENRSFDHYFGTLGGVRGFGDPRVIQLPSGRSVWHQPDGDSFVLPFHPGVPNLGLQFLEDLPHDWATTHAAWNSGRYDQWVPHKGTTTMAHLTRSDIPYHFALADAFTVCDAYHCSLLGPTDPNRYHMWTGWVGNDGLGGGPVVDNAEAGYTWTTFPERLQEAGVSWQVYQDLGTGLDAQGAWGDAHDAYVGNYGDNALLYFRRFQESLPGDPLHDRAKTGTKITAGGSLFDTFREDVLANRLPQVSWIAAPEAYTEHPNWPANYGAWYISQVLDALTANPEVWSKTALFLTYDENDGFFDHMVPPTPPQSRAQGLSTVETTHEIFAGDAKLPAGPYGLGVRVPMIVISPWSKGGWVNSEVFDHTSLIQFIETRFGLNHAGLHESNITAWRRAVTGDLTSAFDFTSPNDHRISLPHTVAYAPPDNIRHRDYKPMPPAVQALPRQEPGARPARAVPYRLHVTGDEDRSGGLLKITFANSGTAAAVFHVRSADGKEDPRTYTVGAGTQVSDTWKLGEGGTAYDLSVYGPNGFLHSFTGDISGPVSPIVAASDDTKQGGIRLDITSRSKAPDQLRITDAYNDKTTTHSLKPGEMLKQTYGLERSFGWYDFTVESGTDPKFKRRLAGHIETGRVSKTDPAIGASVKDV
jgi:phospholipase C